MKSHNPTYGLWNDGEDEVKSSKKYGARALDTSVEEADRANRVHECITWHKFIEIAGVLGYTVDIEVKGGAE